MLCCRLSSLFSSLRLLLSYYSLLFSASFSSLLFSFLFFSSRLWTSLVLSSLLFSILLSSLLLSSLLSFIILLFSSYSIPAQTSNLGAINTWRPEVFLYVILSVCFLTRGPSRVASGLASAKESARSYFQLRMNYCRCG